MEVHPYGHHNHHEIQQLMHHGLLAVRPYGENGEAIHHHLQHAIMAELHEHGQLVGFLLDPRAHLGNMTVEHIQPLYELPGVRLGVARFHHEGHHENRHHGGGLLHELGDMFGGGHHDGGHHW